MPVKIFGFISWDVELKDVQMQGVIMAKYNIGGLLFGSWLYSILCIFFSLLFSFFW